MDTEEKECSGEASSNNNNNDKEILLPMANVSRIMRRSLPSNAKISNDARKMVQECASEFVCFITGEASSKCLSEKRKMLSGEDVLWSMQMLGFFSYVQPLKVYLHKFRDLEEKEKEKNKIKEEVCKYDDDLLMMSLDDIEKIMMEINNIPGPDTNYLHHPQQQIYSGSSSGGLPPPLR